MEQVKNDIIQSSKTGSKDLEENLKILIENEEELMGIQVTEALLEDVNNILVDENIEADDLVNIIKEANKKEELGILLKEISTNDKAIEELSVENSDFTFAYLQAFNLFYEDKSKELEKLDEEIKPILDKLKLEYNKLITESSEI